MNAAIVTVTAISHGFTATFPPPALFSVCLVSAATSAMLSPQPRDFTLSAHPHAALNRHAWAKSVLRVLPVRNVHAHWKSLHDLHVIAARVFRRKQAEQRPGSTRQILYRALIIAIKRIH